MARIRCLLRRPPNLENLSQLKIGDVIYSHDTNVLTGKVSSCTLSQKEGELLLLFLQIPIRPCREVPFFQESGVQIMK